MRGRDAGRSRSPDGPGVGIASRLRAAWRRLPAPARRAAHRALGAATVMRPARTRPPGPVVVAGLFRSANGIGETARTALAALRAAGTEAVGVDLTEGLAPIDLDADLDVDSHLASMPPGPGTLLMFLNAPETHAGLSRLGLHRGRPRWYVIGYWAWELPVFPTGWSAGGRLVSEVWTPSGYVADALRGGIGRPVHAVPPAVSFPAPAPRPPRSGVFEVLTMADALSSLTRKNTAGAISAFKGAFGDDAGARLTVKLRNADRASDEAAAIRAAVRSAGANVTLDERVLPRAALTDMLARADVLLSLHRAEGLGLVPAEAMALGTPCVATGWSGNMSYMTEATAALVRFDLVPVADAAGLYRDGVWAEPDEADAASWLRRLRAEPETALRLGESGAAHVRALMSTEAAGARMTERLEAARQPASRSASAAPPS